MWDMIKVIFEIIGMLILIDLFVLVMSNLDIVLFVVLGLILLAAAVFIVIPLILFIKFIRWIY